MNNQTPRIRIVSHPRLRRLGKNVGQHFGSNASIHYIDKFSSLANPFTHHPDGGAAYYREMIRSALENMHGPVFLEIKMMWQKAFHDHRQYTIILISDCECNPVPVHGLIIKEFLESMGKKL